MFSLLTPIINLFGSTQAASEFEETVVHQPQPVVTEDVPVSATDWHKRVLVQSLHINPQAYPTPHTYDDVSLSIVEEQNSPPTTTEHQCQQRLSGGNRQANQLPQLPHQQNLHNLPLRQQPAPQIVHQQHFSRENFPQSFQFQSPAPLPLQPADSSLCSISVNPDTLIRDTPVQAPASPLLLSIGRHPAFRAVAPSPLNLSHSSVGTREQNVSVEGDVGLALSTVQSFVVITSLLPGGSALASGHLKVGDLIASINDVEHHGSVALAHELLRGPAYSQVQLSVIRFDPSGAALSSEIFLQRLPDAPSSHLLPSLIPITSGAANDSSRTPRTPRFTSNYSPGILGQNMPHSHSSTPRASASLLSGSNILVESLPTAATVMNPANVIGFVVNLDHTYYKVLEDIRRKIIPSSMQRSTVLQSVTEMDFRDVFTSEAELGERGMTFREYSPRVFAVLMHFWRVDSKDVLDAFSDNTFPFMSHSQHTLRSAGDSVFYCPSGRFVIKFINEAEFHWLLDMLPSYYNHFFDMHEDKIVSVF
jgi:hypothetical protein